MMRLKCKQSGHGVGACARRWFGAGVVVAAALMLSTAAAVLLPGCAGGTDKEDKAYLSKAPGTKAKAKRVVVIGMDGMDARLTVQMMDAGELPNLSRMRDEGYFSPLTTSMPPQSPVAWSNFITGAGPGVHGIFDFVHRKPQFQGATNIEELRHWLYYSAADTQPGKGAWVIDGDKKDEQFRMPLSFPPFNHDPGGTKLMRKSKPFWHYLDLAGIPARIYDIPADYPPSESVNGNFKTLAGMGTPDMKGSYGTYQYFSPDTEQRTIRGGGIHWPLRIDGNKASIALEGPADTQHYVGDHSEQTYAKMTIYRDANKPEIRIDLEDGSGESLLLKEGEWSDWVQVHFTMERPSFLPDQTTAGIVRFHVPEIYPDLRLYVSQINIDPTDPRGQKVTEPADWVEDIAADIGRFGTSGFQEDHKALRNRVFTDEEYKTQADFVLSERLRLMNFALDNYEDGLLFFYFSSTDLQPHMFWWNWEIEGKTYRKHPTRSEAQARKYNDAVRHVYKRMDEVVGQVIDKYGKDSLVMIMSDHGFCNFERQFNLNTWLRREGYIQPGNADTLNALGPGTPANWLRTTAYGVSINGLFINLKGRERYGIVDPGQREALAEEIREKLLRVRDPKYDCPAIKYVHKREEIYHGDQVKNAPDLLIGFYRGYRMAWSSIEGGISDHVFSQNRAAWCGDHCIAADEVPGVLFCNRSVMVDDPALIDLAPTILAEFGLPPAKHMTGRNIFSPGGAAAKR